jgi:hypothetical protein
MDDMVKEVLLKMVDADEKETNPTMASGAMMMCHGRQTAVDRARSFLGLLGIYRSNGPVAYDDVVLAMIGMSKQVFDNYNAAMKQIQRTSDSEVNRLVMPELDAGESRFIKTIVAEAIGSQNVQFDKSAVEAVRTLCDAYKRQHLNLGAAMRPGKEL